MEPIEEDIFNYCFKFNIDDIVLYSGKKYLIKSQYYQFTQETISYLYPSYKDMIPMYGIYDPLENKTLVNIPEEDLSLIG